MKSLKYTLIMLFCILALPLLCHAQEKPATQGTEVKPAVEIDTAITVYFFHGNKECPFSKKIEDNSLKAAQEALPDLFKSGGIGWIKVNSELPENAHFIKEFNVNGKAVVLVKTVNGQQTAFKNLDKMWDFIKDDQKFLEFFKAEIKAFVEAK